MNRHPAAPIALVDLSSVDQFDRTASRTGCRGFVPYLLGCFAGVLLLAACVAGPEDPGATGSASDSDKADDVNGADGECVVAHEQWLLTEFAPMSCEDGPDCVGRVAVTTQPSCDGAPRYDAGWRLAYDKHIYLPWLQRYYAAKNSFLLPSSSGFRDHMRFVADTLPTSAELRTHEMMLQLDWRADGLDHAQWLDRHQTLLFDLGVPLQSTS